MSPAHRSGAACDVRKALGEREAVARVGDHLLREAAVDVIAGEARLGAEVLPPAQAVPAAAARPGEPRDPDRGPASNRVTPSPSPLDRPHDLMAEHERHVRSRKLTVQDVEVGPADAARVDGNAHRSRARLGAWQLALLESLADACEDDRSHSGRPGAGLESYDRTARVKVETSVDLGAAHRPPIR